MSIRLPKCVLFDLDGTLLDSLPGIEFSVRAAFAECRQPLLEENLREIIGPPIRTILARAGEVEDATQLDALEQAFRRSYDNEGWRKAAYFPEATRILRLMHEQGHRLFIVSNKPRHISLLILEAEGILGIFEAILTRDSRSPVYAEKKEMIEILLAERQLASVDCLMVGDTMEDANAAATVGIKFALMTHGYGEVPENTSVPIAYRLDHFLQFLPLMAKELVGD